MLPRVRRTGCRPPDRRGSKEPDQTVAGASRWFIPRRVSRRVRMTCAECGTVDERALGGRAHRSDPPAEAEAEDPRPADVPPVVVFCAECVAGEFGDDPSGW